jgi:Glucosamine 6-phosphate synthetase, contains amidotransferase and phosphosugar isomerase domains
MSRNTTQLEHQIRSQPEQLEHVLTSGSVKAQVHAAAEALHRVRRIWVVGTGTSQHAANLGAAMLQDAGRSAHAVSSMQFVKNAPIVGPRTVSSSSPTPGRPPMPSLRAHSPSRRVCRP